MFNSQYYTCEQIDQRLLQGYLDDYNSQNNTSLTKEQFLTLLFNTIGRNSTIDNLVTQIGYYECDTAAGTAAKAITVANYNLFAGGSMKVKFVNKNTANNATLNINSQGAKALYYQGERASSTNSWDEGEVVEIYYDGTNYYANNVKGGSGFGVYDVSVEHPTSGPNEDGKFTLEYVLNPSNVNELIPVNKRYPGMSIQFVSTSNNKYVQYRLMSPTWSTVVTNWQGVDENPTAGSDNMVKSGGVYNAIENAYTPQDLSNNSYFNKRVKYIIEDNGASNIDITKPLRGNIGLYVQNTGKYVNRLYGYKSDNSNIEILVERFDTQQEAINSIVNNPLKHYNNITTCFNPKDVEVETFIDIYLNFGTNSEDMYLLVRDFDNYGKKDSNNLLKSTAAANIGVINVTAEYPLNSGYYQITDANAENYAPAAIPEERRVLGTVLKIEVSQYKYELYKFNGTLNTSSWLLPTRWSRLLDDTFTIPIDNEPTYNSNNAVSSKGVFKYIDFLNITELYPLPYGQYYQIKDASDNNYAPNAVTDANKKRPGMVLHFRTGLMEWQTWIFVGGNSSVWTNADRWKKILDSSDSQNTLVLDNVINVTHEIPLPSGQYYQLDNSSNANYVPQAIYAKYGINYLKSGMTVKFEKSEYKWEFWMFEGRDVTIGSFSIQTRWKRILTTDDIENISEKETVSMNTVEELLIVGQSHAMGHGSIKNKSWASYLSALTDWNVVNLGTDGNGYLSCLKQLLNDNISNAGAKFSDANGGGVCLDFLGGNAENPYFQNGMDGSFAFDNMKRLYSVLKSKGYEMIPSTAFGDQNNSIDAIQYAVAKDEGLQMADIRNTCFRILNKDFLPFWYNGHFGTRTNAIQFYTYMQTANLRRPRTAIKVFKNRNTVSNISDLLYKSKFERLRLFEELSINHRALPSDKYNYVDRLDKFVNDGYSDQAIASEYTSFKNNTAISVTDKCLVEFVLPSTFNGLNGLKFKLTGTGSVNVYVRKYNDISLVIPTSPASALFTFTDVTGVSVGDVFTDTLNTGITFTVTYINITTKSVVCTASGSFTAVGQTTDTLTRQRDSAQYTADSLNNGVPEGYISASENGYGKWELITPNASGEITLENLYKYMDYDKVSFLVDGACSISALEATFEKPTIEKDYMTKPLVTALDLKDFAFNSLYSSIFDQTTIGNRLVNTSGNSYYWNGIESVDGNNKNQIPNYYLSKGATSILHLMEGDKVVFDINGLDRGNGMDYISHFRLKIVGRYYPASNLDVNAGSFTITDKTFDFGRLGVNIEISSTSNSVFTKTEYLPASFVEQYFDIYFDARSGSSIELIAQDDNVELLYFEVLS